VLVLEHQSRMLERPFLARGVDIHQHVAGGQDGCETIHGIPLDEQALGRALTGPVTDR
jgi:hypothetical protein